MEEPRSNAPSSTAAPLDPYTSRAKDVFGNKGNLTALLAAAAASGGLGAYLSSKSPGRRGETSGQRRKRIITNALLAGGAGGAATGAGLYGASLLGEAPKDPSAPAKAPGLMSRLADKLVTPTGVAAGAAGAGGAYLGNRRGAKADTRDALNTLKTRAGASEEKLRATFNSTTPNIKEQVKLRSELADNLYPRGYIPKDVTGRAAMNSQVDRQLQLAGIRRPGRNSDLAEDALRQLKGKRFVRGAAGGVGGVLAGLLTAKAMEAGGDFLTGIKRD